MTSPEPSRHRETAVDLGAPPFLVDAFGSTDVGRVRDRNEDAFLIARLEHALVVERTSVPVTSQLDLTSGVGGALFVVADGMGGEGGGDVASRVGILTVVRFMLARMPWLGQAQAAAAPGFASLPGIRTALDRAVHAGDDEVKRVGSTGPHPRMGTTLTLAYVLWPRLYVAHAGDSRCYVLRQRTLHRLTSDHNFAEQIRLAGGEPLPADSPMQNLLWNALGGETQAQPEVRRHALMLGDVLLLCSDGLTKHVPDAAIADVLVRNEPAEQSCRRLVDAANQAGGSDNVTVVVARFLPSAA